MSRLTTTIRIDNEWKRNNEAWLNKDNEEEFVYCKNCKFYHKDGSWCDLNSHFLDEKDEPCLPYESSSWREFGDDDYCSKGVRK